MQRKRRTLVILGAIALSMVGLSLLLYQLVIARCLPWDCAPSRTFSLEQVDLPARFFPPSAELHPMTFDRHGGRALRMAGTTHRWLGGSATYVVAKFSTDQMAIREFQHIAALAAELAPDAPSVYSDVTSFRSAGAHQQLVDCGRLYGDISCVYGARYAEFTVWLNCSVGEDDMTADQFLAAIKHIDTVMTGLIEER